MLKVDSRRTTAGITWRLMKRNRGRNLLLLLAIVMTTGMFTALFTAASSVIASRQWMWMKQGMEFSHIIIEHLTEEQLVGIRKDEGIAQSGYQIYLTEVQNPELKDLEVKMLCGDLQGARNSMSQPTKGRMPKADDEVAMRTVTLDLLGIPHELGTEVTLEFTLSGRRMRRKFVLSGYWSGDEQYQEQKIWVSESFYEKNAGKAIRETPQEEKAEGNCSLFIWCRNTFGLGRYAKKLERMYHLENTAASVRVNSALELFQDDSFSFGTAALLLALIFLSGYLIIYHVFNVSVADDSRIYGLLKSIGTTGRQIRGIVRRQAFLLAGAGMLPGLLMGYDIGVWMARRMESGMVVFSGCHPWIFAVSAAFTLLTVYAGCVRPGRTAAKLSPAEAVKITDLHFSGRRRKPKSRECFTPLALAGERVRRTWKKAALAVLSLALPIVLLNVTFGIMRGFRFEMFLDAYCSFDYEVSGLTENRKSSNRRAVTPELMDRLRSHPDVERMALVYASETQHRLDDTGYQNLAGILKQAQKEGILEGELLKKEKEELAKREVTARVMGINETALEKMEIREGEADYEKMKTGGYVLLENLWGYPGQLYHPGDRLTVRFENGRSKEYTVLGIVEPPTDLTWNFRAEVPICYQFFLPEEEYLSMEENKNAMMIGVDIRDGREAAFARWLAGCARTSEKTVYINSRAGLLEEARAYAHSQYMILGILGGILFAVGVLNFFYAFAASCLAGRQELAILRAVGMTEKQMRSMLLAEFLMYAAAAVLLADTLGMAAAGAVMEQGAIKAFFFRYETVIWPSLFAVPVTGGLAAAAGWMGKELLRLPACRGTGFCADERNYRKNR